MASLVAARFRPFIKTLMLLSEHYEFDEYDRYKCEATARFEVLGKNQKAKFSEDECFMYGNAYAPLRQERM